MLQLPPLSRPFHPSLSQPHWRFAHQKLLLFLLLSFNYPLAASLPFSTLQSSHHAFTLPRDPNTLPDILSTIFFYHQLRISQESFSYHSNSSRSSHSLSRKDQTTSQTSTCPHHVSPCIYNLRLRLRRTNTVALLCEHPGDEKRRDPTRGRTALHANQ